MVDGNSEVIVYLRSYRRVYKVMIHDILNILEQSDYKKLFLSMNPLNVLIVMCL